MAAKYQRELIEKYIKIINVNVIWTKQWADNGMIHSVPPLNLPSIYVPCNKKSAI